MSKEDEEGSVGDLPIVEVDEIVGSEVITYKGLRVVSKRRDSQRNRVKSISLGEMRSRCGIPPDSSTMMLLCAACGMRTEAKPWLFLGFVSPVCLEMVNHS